MQTVNVRRVATYRATKYELALFVDGAPVERVRYCLRCSRSGIRDYICGTREGRGMLAMLNLSNSAQLTFKGGAGPEAVISDGGREYRVAFTGRTEREAAHGGTELPWVGRHVSE